MNLKDVIIIGENAFFIDETTFALNLINQLKIEGVQVNYEYCQRLYELRYNQDQLIDLIVQLLGYKRI